MSCRRNRNRNRSRPRLSSSSHGSPSRVFLSRLERRRRAASRHPDQSSRSSSIPDPSNHAASDASSFGRAFHSARQLPPSFGSPIRRRPEEDSSAPTDFAASNSSFLHRVASTDGGEDEIGLFDNHDVMTRSSLFPSLRRDEESTLLDNMLESLDHQEVITRLHDLTVDRSFRRPSRLRRRQETPPEPSSSSCRPRPEPTTATRRRRRRRRRRRGRRGSGRGNGPGSSRSPSRRSRRDAPTPNSSMSVESRFELYRQMELLESLAAGRYDEFLETRERIEFARRMQERQRRIRTGRRGLSPDPLMDWDWEAEEVSGSRSRGLSKDAMQTRTKVVRWKREQQPGDEDEDEEAGEVDQEETETAGEKEEGMSSFEPTPPSSSSTTNSSCAICLMDYEEGEDCRLLLMCGHLFHRVCIDHWLRDHETCPVCRMNQNE